MSLDVVILGPPGAGKGTQAARMSTEADVPHIATGEMLRAGIADGTELGRRVREVVERGDLVSDELMIALIRERLAAGDTEDGFILDGFPRTLAQAEALDAMLAELERELTIVLEFQLPEELAYQRLLGRGRSDDTPETIRHRLDAQRVPDELIAYYRAKGILVGIHAEGTVDEVFAEVQSVLETASAHSGDAV
jgi:adenylate kinase